MNKENKNTEKLEAYIGTVMRIGVIISAIFMLFGIISSLMFPDNIVEISSITFSNIYSNLISLNPYAYMYLGIFVLILTPVIRVVASIILFATQKDKLYTAITTMVLIILIISFFISYFN